jgi:hypothetical protein
MAKHLLPATLREKRPIRILVIGAGGNGSQILILQQSYFSQFSYSSQPNHEKSCEQRQMLNFGSHSLWR